MCANVFADTHPCRCVAIHDVFPELTMFFQGAQYFFRDVVADIYRRVTIYDIVSECTGGDGVKRVLRVYTVTMYRVFGQCDDITYLFTVMISEVFSE